MDAEKKVLVNDLLKKLENLHYPSAPVYTKTNKAAALFRMQEPEHELEAIYNLVESHAPALRFTAVHRYEKSLDSGDGVVPINKTHVNFKCAHKSTDDKIQTMLEQLDDMPKEWTIIQLTSQFNIQESVEINLEKHYTSPLHLTVLDCGKERALPFALTLEPPKDQTSGKIMEIRQEMYSILKDNVQGLEGADQVYKKKGMVGAEREAYRLKRYRLNCQLEHLVKQIQDKWLGEWKCLLIGKFIDDEIEKLITSGIEEALRDNECCDITEKNRRLLYKIVQGSDYLSLTQLNKALKYILPKEQDKNAILALIELIRDWSLKYSFAQQLRHPVILIVDEKLDFIPWEMIDVLQDQPVSRMPSLHFTYGLYKEHESKIANGLITNINSKNGRYLLNPDLNLKNMEIRLKQFYDYWLPDWSGSVGVTPSADDFKDMLTNSSILVYNGHGNGTQFLASEKIQRMRLDTVVLLFGCNSVKLVPLGPQVEMFSTFYMYLIACSPCVLGTLWPVTDLETDLVTTEFLSQLIPSSAPTHWKLINKLEWEMDGNIETNINETLSNSEKHEPELLRALCKAREAARQYLMKAAFVVRGLPVKVI